MLIAPVGVQGILHKDGELATARAAASVGVPLIMSTAATRSIEAVAKASGDGHRWFQLYWYAYIFYFRSCATNGHLRPRSNDITLSILGRAKAAGFTTLVVTLDTFILGWRPHDLDTAYLPFAASVGAQVGTSDPVFMQCMGLPVRPDEQPAFPLDLEAFRGRLAAGDEQAVAALKLGGEWLRETNSGKFRTWEDLAFLREN